MVGHIQPKGLLTALLVTLKISEDGRFCFAGVVNGSNEIIAIDMSCLPVHDLNTVVTISHSANSGKGRSKSGSNPIRNLDPDLVTVYGHVDHKLKGFANVTRVGHSNCLPAGCNLNTGRMESVLDPPPCSSAMDSEPKYRLVCGRGRVLHIWDFKPDSLGYKWVCIHSVTASGYQMEFIEFRNGGAEMISKHSDFPLRVWNLRQYEGATSYSKPTFEDVPNSTDIKRVLGDYGFGGVYDFAVVKIGASKFANRDAFEMPQRSLDDDNGLRRKRMMRQIDDVIGTSDGRHVAVLCADGGVFYFENSYGEPQAGTCDNFQANSHNVNFQRLVELSTLQRDPTVDTVWSLRRVGRRGEVMLLRAINVPANKPPAEPSIHDTMISSAALEIFRNEYVKIELQLLQGRLALQ